MARKRKKIPRRSEKRARPQEARAAIDFCRKCGTILVPTKKGRSVALRCRRCGYELKKQLRSLKIVEEKRKPRGVIILEKDMILLPMTERECTKCGNRRAWYWLQQTRSADEPPTQFFRCTKCKSVWREYK